MRIPQWIPGRPDLPGLGLAVFLGAAAFAITAIAPPSALVSETLIALVFGALVVNTPLRNVIGMARPGTPGHQDQYGPGLRFVGKWVLRASIIAMGLKVEARFFGAGSAVLVLGVVATTLPLAFLTTHAVAMLFGLRRPLADVLSAGTMICGGSAVNAVAPVVAARREEQAIALGAMYLFSLAALVLFRPVALIMGLSPQDAGIWSGLAVQDLASAVAVGAQMGDGGSAMAAAAKSLRVALLAPTMIVFALLRRQEGAPPKELRKTALDLIPLFVVGYVVLGIVRTVGDRLFAGAVMWNALLATDRFFVTLAMGTVAAAIGLHLDVGRLLAAGVPALVVCGVASVATAGVSLGMVHFSAGGAHGTAALLGVSAVLGTFALFRMTTGREAEKRALERRLADGAPLSVAEAIRLLSLLDQDGAPPEEVMRKIMRQLFPSLGELIHLRSSPLPHGQGCRWATYWEGKSGWALVAVCREPGSATPIHAHPHRLIGKTAEGSLEEFVFHERPGTVELVSRRILDQNEIVEAQALDTVHLVRAVGRVPSVDLQLRGPEVGSPGKTFAILEPLDLDQLLVGAVIPVHVGADGRPGHGGEGPSVGAVAALARR